MSDIFREVDEDLRRDRMERLFKRYGGIAIAVVVVLVGSVAGYNIWTAREQSQREEATAALTAAVDAAAAGPDRGIEALSAVAARGGSDVATLARLKEAALLAGKGDRAAAVAIYDRVAADTVADTAYRDLATLLSVMHQLGSGDPAALTARLQPLSADTSPWRFSAREMEALLAARAGNTERAQTLFQQLADDASAPSGVRSRATDLAALYGKTR
ncbi:tetratricopeptide repeat protein [Azospirillum halopraeferens]|uniref:tetratricopeptide repeat protein n=1 Tax=Azospirillum halopraeferens TaxID=34010 RepID=UPI00041A8141|nr:tetratricopeptide repeat protein [Azospirillum halopraeferens]